MSVKEYWMQVSFIIRNVWNKLSVLMIVPFFMLFVLLNIFNEYDIINKDEQSMYFIDNRMLCFIPVGLGFLLIASAWCYVVGNGRELFYVWRTVIFNESVVLTVLFMTAIFAEFMIVYRYIVGFRWDMLINYTVFSFFLSGGMMCLVYRIRKMTVLIAVYVLSYLFELCGDYGSFGTYSVFSWHYDDVSYLVSLIGMCIIGFLCWRDYYNQIQLYDDLG